MDHSCRADEGGIEHRVPLTARCIEILESAKELSNGGPYVFPGRSPKKPLSNMVARLRIE
jgi:integrase